MSTIIIHFLVCILQWKGSTYHLYISFKTDIAALFLWSYMNVEVAVLFQEI